MAVPCYIHDIFQYTFDRLEVRRVMNFIEIIGQRMNLMGVSISISHIHLFMLTKFLFHWSFDLCNVESSLPYINYFLWRYVTLISKKSLRWCKKLWLKIKLKNMYGVSKVDQDIRITGSILKIWMFWYLIFLTLCAPIVQYNGDNDLQSHSNLNSF